MKKTAFLLSLLVAVLSANCTAQETKTMRTAENTARTLIVSFDYTHSGTIASNQFAVWIEDDGGRVVKTLFVTSFTGSRRGYERRSETLPRWVQNAKPAAMAGAELDAVSSSTPRAGRQSFVWDFTDSAGNAVPAGTYRCYVEASIYWGSTVRYYADIAPGASGIFAVRSERTEPTNSQNANMITNVEMKVEMNAQAQTEAKRLGGLTPEAALEFLKSTPDVVIVEVNTDYWKLKTGFIGALHIPHDQMASRYNEIPRGRPVILHCGAGVVSVPAYETLCEKRPDIPVLGYIAGHPPVAEYNKWHKEHHKRK